ncbi:MAG TPA: protein kinase [Pyrinomonadaceae bacterium]|nr:protein kinase [Pyrinomonadaceae bacterium]
MIAPGTVLQNRYVVERQIGVGGMGAVYVATDRRFGSTVALKETFFDDPNLRKAFEREARLLNHLRHHALPRVSDHFEEADGQFLVMEYIAGEDLSQMLKARAGQGFPAAQVTAWADQLLDALDYLHTQEPPVVHRDIKPQNLKLTSRDQIVLLDFGLAKGTPLQTRVTNTASLFGYSFNYAPIEQMQGTGTDPRSDLYSLGATLYHLLTGQTPPDALSRATAVLNNEPDPLRPASDGAAHVPAEVSEVLSRAMALSAAKRFASAAEMRAALREAARHAAEAKPVTPGAAAVSTLVESEQKTRLLDSSGAARTNAHEPGATRPAGTQETATVVNEGATAVADDGAVLAQTTARGAEATSVESPDGKSSIKESGGDSDVTRMRAAGAAAGGGSRRWLGPAAGVAALALVGAGLYSFVQSTPPGLPAAQPTPQATAQPTQATAQPTQATAQPAPTELPATPAQQTPAPASTATPSNAQRRAAPAATPARERASEAPRPETPEPPPPGQAGPPPGLPPEAYGDPMLRGRDLRTNPLTREELRAVLRRAAQERRRARMERDRIIEEERRQRFEEQRRRGLPAPPP